MFFFQYLVQAGLFFVVPLFLSVCLGLSALETGVGCSRSRSRCSPPRSASRASCRTSRLGSWSAAGLFSLLVGTLVLLAALDADAGPRSSSCRCSSIGLGIGALASQLGAVTVSAVPDEDAPEVGGVQNTMTNLGASLGTALAGSVMIAAVSSSFLANIVANPEIPDAAKSQAQVELAGGVAFVSDADLKQALDEEGVDPATTEEALDAYGDARLDGLRTALAILAAASIGALFLGGSIPKRQPGSA